MPKVTVQILGGSVSSIDLDVGEEGISAAEIKEFLGRKLGPQWRYSALLVGGRSADYLGDQKITGGDVVAALRQVQGAAIASPAEVPAPAKRVHRSVQLACHPARGSKPLPPGCQPAVHLQGIGDV